MQRYNREESEFKEKTRQLSTALPRSSRAVVISASAP